MNVRDRLVRAATFVLTRWGDGDNTHDDWRDDLCRCLHRRWDHYSRCTRCGCSRFRLKVRMR